MEVGLSRAVLVAAQPLLSAMMAADSGSLRLSSNTGADSPSSSSCSTDVSAVRRCACGPPYLKNARFLVNGATRGFRNAMPPGTTGLIVVPAPGEPASVSLPSIPTVQIGASSSCIELHPVLSIETCAVVHSYGLCVLAGVMPGGNGSGERSTSFGALSGHPLVETIRSRAPGA